MNAEEYATKNAKTPEEVFSLYHAFEAGKVSGMNHKFSPATIVAYIGLMIFFAIIFAELIPQIINIRK